MQVVTVLGISAVTCADLPDNTLLVIATRNSAILRYAYHTPAIAKAAVVKKKSRSINHDFSVDQKLVLDSVAISTNSDAILTTKLDDVETTG